MIPASGLISESMPATIVRNPIAVVLIPLFINSPLKCPDKPECTTDDLINF